MFSTHIAIAFGAVFVCSAVAYLFGYWQAVGDVNERHREQVADLHMRLFAGTSFDRKGK